MQCRSANQGSEKTFKQTELDVYDQCNDDLAQQVQVWVQGVITDLHAADAQYHKDYEESFMAPDNIQAAKIKESHFKEYVNPAYELLVSELQQDRLKCGIPLNCTQFTFLSKAETNHKCS